jgi:hypothetical protein
MLVWLPGLHVCGRRTFPTAEQKPDTWSFTLLTVQADGRLNSRS